MPAASKSSVAGWDDFIESLRSLPDRMLAKLPEEKRGDPQFQQEVARLALESIASTTIDAIGGDGDFPAFLPTIGQLLNVGQPNADTIYRSARISPGGSYRIRGRKGLVSLTEAWRTEARSWNFMQQRRTRRSTPPWRRIGKCAGSFVRSGDAGY